jgi:C4-dicarboxylate transporter
MIAPTIILIVILIWTFFAYLRGDKKDACRTNNENKNLGVEERAAAFFLYLVITEFWIIIYLLLWIGYLQ